jgi:hypothetical protein
LKLIESKEACSTLAEEIYELESKIWYIYENRKGNKFFNEFIKEYKLMINKYKIDKCY